MAPHPHVFAMVLAGGEGKRLAPLTADRAKPAVPTRYSPKHHLSHAELFGGH